MAALWLLVAPDVVIKTNLNFYYNYGDFQSIVSSWKYVIVGLGEWTSLCCSKLPRRLIQDMCTRSSNRDRNKLLYPTLSVGSYYLSLPLIPASDSEVLNCTWLHCLKIVSCFMAINELLKQCASSTELITRPLSNLPSVCLFSFQYLKGCGIFSIATL